MNFRKINQKISRKREAEVIEKKTTRKVNAPKKQHFQ